MGRPRATLRILALVGALAGCGGGGNDNVVIVQQLPSTPDRAVIDLGTVALTRQNQDQTFSVTVSDAISLTIVADGGDATDIDISLLRDPGGAELVTPNRADANPLTGDVSPQAVGQSVATAIVPSRREDALADGTYVFSVGSFDAAGNRTAATVRLTAIVKRNRTPCGRLPLHVYLVGTPGLTAAALDGSPGFGKVMGEITRRFAEIGIQVEVVQAEDVSGEAVLRLSVLDVLDPATQRTVPDVNLNRQSDEMDELFRRADVGQEAGVPFFLVDSFVAGEGTTVASGGRPGPSVVPRTVQSGVVLSTLGGLDRQSNADLAALGQAAANEIARYLGAQVAGGADRFSLEQALVLLRSAAVAPSPPPPDGQSIQVVELGTAALSDAGRSFEFHICVEDASSLTLIADGQGSSLVSFDGMEFPERPVTLGDACASASGPVDLRTVRELPTQALRIPNTLALPLQDGTYRFRVSANAADDVTVTALVNRRPRLTGGRVSLNVYLVGVPDLKAVYASKDARIRAIRDKLDAVLRQVGLRLGEVDYHDVPESDAAGLTVISDLTELWRLFSLARNNDPARLDLFLIQQFLIPNVVGIAGGIPGPSHIPPTSTTGVAAAVLGNEDDVEDTEVLAQTVAHEVGHYLGLFHTTEVDDDAACGAPIAGRVFDPISDTPMCGRATVESRDWLSCPDVTNLLFPIILVPDIDQSLLTPEQGFVLRRGPLVND